MSHIDFFRKGPADRQRHSMPIRMAITINLILDSRDN